MGLEKDTTSRPEELTAEEHRARAMLMGLIYSPWGNYYMTPTDNKLTHNIVRIDANTLEPLTGMQAFERYKADRRRARSSRHVDGVALP